MNENPTMRHEITGGHLEARRARQNAKGGASSPATRARAAPKSPPLPTPGPARVPCRAQGPRWPRWPCWRRPMSPPPREWRCVRRLEKERGKSARRDKSGPLPPNLRGLRHASAPNGPARRHARAGAWPPRAPRRARERHTKQNSFWRVFGGAVAAPAAQRNRTPPSGYILVCVRDGVRRGRAQGVHKTHGARPRVVRQPLAAKILDAWPRCATARTVPPHIPQIYGTGTGYSVWVAQEAPTARDCEGKGYRDALPPKRF